MQGRTPTTQTRATSTETESDAIREVSAYVSRTVQLLAEFMHPTGWTGQFTARATDGDPEHARGPANELLDYPALGRPLILTGTFNKILSYPTGIYADQHFRFHEALRDADALVVVGYGFRDKAINARMVAWAERPGDRRLVVLHPDPVRLGQNARGAIRGKWRRWQDTGLLRFVPEYLGPATNWATIRSSLDS